MYVTQSSYGLLAIIFYTEKLLFDLKIQPLKSTNTVYEDYFPDMDLWVYEKQITIEFTPHMKIPKKREGTWL